jgi:hypothetical protein
MSSCLEEIQQLQLRILKLEKQKKESDENFKKISIEHNFKVINDVLVDKKTKIYRYNSKTLVSDKSYDYQLITHLEAIHNILQILDNRLKKLEDK